MNHACHGGDMFDADALQDALAAPTVKWAGNEYTGRVLSAHEFAPLHERLMSSIAAMDYRGPEPWAKRIARAALEGGDDE